MSRRPTASTFDNPRKRVVKEVVDPAVHKLVLSWLGEFPEEWNVNLQHFLLLGKYEVRRHGERFSRLHGTLLTSILTHYAESLALFQDAVDEGRVSSRVADDQEERCDAFNPQGYTDVSDAVTVDQEQFCMFTGRM